MRRERGFTLVEVMVVIAIIAVVVGLGARGLRSLAKSDLRESSAHLSGAMRYLFDRASTTGKMHRLVLDMETDQYWAEVSDDRFYIPREAESEQAMRRREDREADEDEEEQKRLDRAAKNYDNSSTPASSSFDLSKLEVGDFKPKRARFAAFKEVAIKPVKLKKAKIRSVYTPRLTEPLTADVVCDRDQPVLRGLGALAVLHRAQRVQERRLGDVLRVLGVAEHRKRVAVDVADVPLVHPLELAVGRAGPRQERRHAYGTPGSAITCGVAAATSAGSEAGSTLGRVTAGGSTAGAGTGSCGTGSCGTGSCAASGSGSAPTAAAAGSGRILGATFGAAWTGGGAAVSVGRAGADRALGAAVVAACRGSGGAAARRRTVRRSG